MPSERTPVRVISNLSLAGAVTPDSVVTVFFTVRLPPFEMFSNIEVPSTKVDASSVPVASSNEV